MITENDQKLLCLAINFAQEELQSQADDAMRKGNYWRTVGIDEMSQSHFSLAARLLNTKSDMEQLIYKIGSALAPVAT